MLIDSTGNRFLRLVNLLIQPGIIALGVIFFLYTLIFWSVNRGVSVDEGYYLLGYLTDQPVKYALTDFHHIVRSLFFFLPEDNALPLRIIRVILTIIALYFFTANSYKLLLKEYSIWINKPTYFSLSFLTGTLCFSYASPVLYYDSIEMIIYLIAFALLFEILQSHNLLLSYLFSFLLGSLIIFAMTNYLPAGIFLLLIVSFLIVLYKKLKHFLFIICGFICGAIVYNFFIHSLWGVTAGIIEIYTSASEFELTKYETSGQLGIIIRYFSDLIITIIPVVIGSTVYFFLRKYLQKFSVLIDLFFLAVTVYLVYRLSFYYSNVILLPVVVVFTDLLIINKLRIKGSFSRKGFLLFAVFLAIPLLGVLGSNQLLARKMFLFMPFWFLALYFLLAELKLLKNKKLINKYNILMILTVTVVFVFQGFIRHPHYNYSIKRSKYLIGDAVRFKGIKVSEYQNKFYENGIRELNEHGFRPGDNILAFFETYMLVYAAGGYVPDGMTYWAYHFAGDPDNIPDEKVNFIIINENEIGLITEFLSQTNWDFPASYKRIDLGTDGHNLTQMGYNYILFSSI